MTPAEQQALNQAMQDEGIKKLQGRVYDCTKVDAMDFRFVPFVRAEQSSGRRDNLGY